MRLGQIWSGYGLLYYLVEPSSYYSIKTPDWYLAGFCRFDFPTYSGFGTVMAVAMLGTQKPCDGPHTLFRGLAVF